MASWKENNWASERTNRQHEMGHHWEQGMGEGLGVPLADRNPSQGFSQGQDFAGRGPKGWQRNDARIEDDVCEALTRAPHIDATDIEVKVAGGEVTLSGDVDSRNTKRAAEDLVERCHGVRDVHNSLRVRA